MIYVKHHYSDDWKPYESVSDFLNVIFDENENNTKWRWRYNISQPASDFHADTGLNNEESYRDSIMAYPDYLTMLHVIEYCLFNWDHMTLVLEETSGTYTIDHFECFDILPEDEYNWYIQECEKHKDDGKRIVVGVGNNLGRGISYISWEAMRTRHRV